MLISQLMMRCEKQYHEPAATYRCVRFELVLPLLRCTAIEQADKCKTNDPGRRAIASDAYVAKLLTVDALRRDKKIKTSCLTEAYAENLTECLPAEWALAEAHADNLTDRLSAERTFADAVGTPAT